MSNIDFSLLITSEDKALEEEKKFLAEAATNAQKYLDSTDWYITRKVETGKDVPEEVLLQREEARVIIKGS